VGALNVGAAPDSNDIASDLLPSIDSSFERLKVLRDDYSSRELEARVGVVRSDLESFLEEDSWLARYPGRLILSQFASVHIPGVSYEAFRNLVVEKIALSDYRPQNMRDVLEAIVDA
jgi:hypothetical protein